MKIHEYEFLALLRRKSLVVILSGIVLLGSDKEDSKILTVVEFISAADFLTYVWREQ